MKNSKMAHGHARSIRQIHAAARDDIGDLVTRRPVPARDLSQIDPFLFLNHHGPQVYPADNAGLPFGPHPHRGFETVTFILDGSLGHHDSGGHESIIEAGGVQWMTAGSGLVHAELSPEVFKREGGRLEILQLWLNLPSRLKMVRPSYTGLQSHEIPAIALEGGGSIDLVAGTYGGETGPIASLTGVFMSTVRLASGGSVRLPAPNGRSVFCYVVCGAVRSSGRDAESWNLIEFNDDGDMVSVEAETDALLLYAHADPIGEPVVTHGPFVMNSREEIADAIRDYQAGRFSRDALVPR